MSKQLTFTLACAVVLSALLPGVAGYLSARLEAVEAAERNLQALEARLSLREARDARPVSFPAPCIRTPAGPRLNQAPVTALGEHDKRWQRDSTGGAAGPIKALEETGEH
ncbi:hypothetical protein FAF44_22025 [Nonomuraea sp. MG754425]|uniref:hypothetical protein n=1 Tax=Nonomuraea sp. MG754425 TaxID=2570319 RepID=UPI001F3AA3CC|nr:hypothetical protein [Nonomuraea sp. MG754425]MCF6471055.1 hypothetical protein [Nonomuraea sp. MG754425]